MEHFCCECGLKSEECECCEWCFKPYPRCKCDRAYDLTIEDKEDKEDK